MVLWQNANANLPGCHAYRKGENDRSLITSDNKTDRSTRQWLSDRVAANTIERGHCRTGHADQCPDVAASRREPPCAVRGAGALGPQAVASRALRFCRMEGMQGRPR